MSLKKARIKSSTLLSRLGGFSAFGFGVSLKLPEADRTVVRDLLTSLEDRRVLYVGAIWEQPQYVLQSVQQMRTELTTTIKRLGEKSPAIESCRHMRGACRDFMSKFEGDKLKDMDHSFGKTKDSEDFLMALGALRAVFGQQIALLANKYEIDLEAQLASILPPLPE